MQNDRIQWHAPEYFFYTKSREWFIALSIVALALLVVAVFLKDFLFAVVIVVGAVALALHAKHPPREIEAEVNRTGLLVNQTFYPYSSLQSFWIDQHNRRGPKLLARSQKLLMPLIIVPLGEQDVDVVHGFLENYLPQQEQYEPLSHKLLEYLGF